MVESVGLDTQASLVARAASLTVLVLRGRMGVDLAGPEAFIRGRFPGVECTGRTPAPLAVTTTEG